MQNFSQTYCRGLVEVEGRGGDGDEVPFDFNQKTWNVATESETLSVGHTALYGKKSKVLDWARPEFH